VTSARIKKGPIRAVFDALEITLNRPAAGWIILAIAVIGYVIAYVSHPLHPGTGAEASTRGWWTWNDQQRYLQEARAIAAGSLSATNYHYPVGYPALGAVFVRWMPSHPFLIPDLILIATAAVIWWKLARRWLSATLALAAAIGFVVCHRWLLGVTMVVPWNTIATQTLMWAGVAVALCHRERAAVVWLAGLAAATYVVRPIDAVTFGPLLIFAVWRITPWREKMTAALLGISVIALAVVGVGLLNRQVFGQWRTPYDVISTQTIGFFGYPIAYKLYWLLVDGRAFFEETQGGLLFRYPWLFFAVPGLAFLVRREHGVGWAIAAAMAVNLGLYLNYNDLLPSDIYRFTLIHYLTWSFPIFLVLGFAAAQEAMCDRVVRCAFVATPLIALLALGLQMEPRAIEARSSADGRGWQLTDHRPLLIEFPGTSMGELSNVRLEGVGLTEYSQYLIPFVPTDLKLLLGSKANGSTLSLANASEVRLKPVVSVFRWKWSPVLLRLSAPWSVDD
jgi:hypothetical protein